MRRRAVRLAALAGLAGLAACARHRLASSWYAGGVDCAGRPGFQVRAYDADFYVLRQAACTNYEKPFLYLLFGDDRALLLDSGAGGVDVVTPVDTLVRRWSARRGRPPVPLVVAHRHGHGDHVAGDSLFARRPNTTVVGRDTAASRARV